jgi:primosomal protein N' (replication factor Y) (superfamily II helicase)
MFIKISLLKGFSKPLTYKAPDSSVNLIGKIVKVPIRNSISIGIVEAAFEHRPNVSYEIKEILEVETFPEDPHYINFINQLAEYYQVNHVQLIKRIRGFILKPGKKEFVQKKEVSKITNVTLTEEQQNVCTFLSAALDNKKFTPTLLHGVTSSGKTEVYKKLITKAISQNKSVILLLPEVTLALQFENILRKALPEIEILGFHSSAATSEKNTIWKNMLAAKPTLIVGVHLPVLLPIPNLGLIIVDEEHESGYQEKKHPKTNSKEAALLKARQHQIPILLGSATPSISSMHSVKKHGWHFFQIKKRFAGQFPKVEIVKLKDHKQRKNFWISQKLEDEIRDRLAKKEQTILFLNRRGYCFFVQCKHCGFVFNCKNCAVSLTLHSNNWMYCHYCNLSAQLVNECPDCKKFDPFLRKGVGTQQMVTILQKIFPAARIARGDMDTSTKKIEWKKTIEMFSAGELDVLIGTQTITKGYHFPNVTLVGILWADINLNMPFYNKSETTLQQLIQVAGRAGRQSEESKVIVQTIREHKIFNYINEVDYLKFYSHELEARELCMYPPFGRLSIIEVKHKDDARVDAETHQIFALLMKYKTKNVMLLGPTEPLVNKVKNWHTKQIYIKAASFQETCNLYKLIDKNKFKSAIFFTPNPLN